LSVKATHQKGELATPPFLIMGYKWRFFIIQIFIIIKNIFIRPYEK